MYPDSECNVFQMHYKKHGENNTSQNKLHKPSFSIHRITIIYMFPSISNLSLSTSSTMLSIGSKNIILISITLTAFSFLCLVGCGNSPIWLLLNEWKT